MDNFFCAEESRQANEELIGTAGNYQYYVLIECPLPWAAGMFESPAISPSMKAQAFELGEAFMARKRSVRPLLIFNEQFKQDNGTRLIIYSVNQGLANSYTKQEFLLDKLEDSTAVVRDCLVGKQSSATKIESSTRDILVCTHGSHDRCCSRYGKPFYYEALTTVSDLGMKDVRIWQCSHIGGHRFAPTAIDLPSGRWYGRLDRDSFASILKSQGDPALFQNVYRGWGLLPKPAQALERQLLVEYGWQWLDYRVSCEVSQPDGDRNFDQVELTFQTPDGVDNTVNAEVVPDESQAIELRTGCNKTEPSKLPKLVVKRC